MSESMIGADRKRTWQCAIVFGIALVFFAMPVLSHAAMMYLDPSTGVYTVGEEFSASVKLDSEGAAINAVEASIEYDTRELSIISVSKDGSHIEGWNTEPSYSNIKGVIEFGGSMKDFNGGDGTLVTVRFKVKTQGKSVVRFASGAALAVNTKGSDVLSALQASSYTLVPKTNTPLAGEYTTLEGTPLVTSIVSSTHPDPEQWYASDTAMLAWDAPEGVTATRISVSRRAGTLPNVLYTGAVTKKEVNDLTDGIWYAHVQLKNGKGWGNVATFPLHIDTVAPQIERAELSGRSDLSDPRVRLRVEATDKTAGIDRYEMRIDDSTVERWIDDGSHAYVTNPVDPGEHSMVVKAIDKAGNAAETSVAFTVDALEAPTIIPDYAQFQLGKQVAVKGKTIYLGATVSVWVRHGGNDPKRYGTTANTDGSFAMNAKDRWAEGSYVVWAEVSNGAGAKSVKSESVQFAIQQPEFIRVGSQIVSVLGIVIGLAIAIAVLIGGVWYGIRLALRIKKNIRTKTQVAERDLKTELDAVRILLKEQMTILGTVKDRRALTAAEKMVADRLAKHLTNIEVKIDKDIDAIDDVMHM